MFYLFVFVLKNSEGVFLGSWSQHRGASCFSQTPRNSAVFLSLLAIHGPRSTDTPPPGSLPLLPMSHTHTQKLSSWTFVLDTISVQIKNGVIWAIATPICGLQEPTPDSHQAAELPSAFYNSFPEMIQGFRGLQFKD